MATQREIDQAARDGANHGQKESEQNSTSAGIIISLLFHSNYDPPVDPDAKEVYNYHFNHPNG
jgi:hypothetical protein